MNILFKFFLMAFISISALGDESLYLGYNSKKFVPDIKQRRAKIEYFKERLKDSTQNEKESAFSQYMSCLEGNYYVVYALIELGVDPNIKGHDGNSVIHCPASIGRLDVVKFLAKKGAKLDEKGFKDATPLFWASSLNSNFDTVKYLLKEGADPNSKIYNGQTPIFQASLYGADKIVELLLKNGAKADIRDKNGNTPLHVIAEKGDCRFNYSKTIKILIKAGVDLNSKNAEGFTPLDLAKKRGCKRLMKILS